MNKILNAIKCSICREILESPVILPCYDTICKKHVLNNINDVIRCEQCGVEHQIPTNGFHANNALQEIIDAEIANLELGSVHKEAKKSCESVEEALKEFELLLKDPYFFTHEKINELKNAVELKGEELKMIIDKEIKKLIDRLEEYERKSKEFLSSYKFKVESKKLEKDLKLSKYNLDSWFESLNKVKLDEDKWKKIIDESKDELKIISEKSEGFKNKLLLNKFEQNQAHVNCFKNAKIDIILEPIKINNFMDSRIINESLSQKLDELLTKKYLNGRKWSLLYQGSRDGFGASDFHSHCDNKANTLTIVKSRNGNIFGGFTRAEWKSTISWEYDKKAFVFSIVNKENKPMLFEQRSDGIYQNTTTSFKEHGPEFGEGNDIFIADDSNLNTRSFSNLGKTYTHPDYQYGSEKAKTILAGSHYFQVQEIEVFRIQQLYKEFTVR